MQNPKKKKDPRYKKDESLKKCKHDLEAEMLKKEFLKKEMLKDLEEEAESFMDDFNF